jgi:outer membrane receptor protein involved in Fe transport
LLKAELTENYCGFINASGKPETFCPVGSVDAPDGPESPEGTELPVTPRFKGNLTARYQVPIGELDAHVQGSAVYQGKRWADVRVIEREILGRLPSYVVADFALGVARDSWNAELFFDNAFDERAEITRFAECAEQVCGPQTYIVTNRPRTMGLRFGQKF